MAIKSNLSGRSCHTWVREPVRRMDRTAKSLDAFLPEALGDTTLACCELPRPKEVCIAINICIGEVWLTFLPRAFLRTSPGSRIFENGQNRRSSKDLLMPPSLRNRWAKSKEIYPAVAMPASENEHPEIGHRKDWWAVSRRCLVAPPFPARWRQSHQRKQPWQTELAQRKPISRQWQWITRSCQTE